MNKEKQYPVLYSSPEECCGCTACYAVCPSQAIQMIADKEGFLYPVIEMKKCVCCYKCISVCALK